MKKIFILLLAVFTFFMSPITAYADSYEDYVSGGDLIRMSKLECPDPDETFNVSSDRYLVYRLGNKNYVWFMSRYATFRFADQDPTKTLYVSDHYSQVYELTEFFTIIVETDDTGNVLHPESPNKIATAFNNDKSMVSFLYSTHDISTYFVECDNRSTSIYIPRGYGLDIDIDEPVEKPEDSSTIVDDDTATNALLRRILDALLWLPNYILDGINNVITPKITSLLNQIITVLNEIPTKILNGIKEIFSGLLVPDTDEIKSDVSAFKKSIFDSMGFDVEELETSMAEIEPEAIPDITIDLNINNQVQTVKVLDTHYLVVGVDYFRPYIRGFIMLMLFFNVMNHIASIVHIRGINGGDKS